MQAPAGEETEWRLGQRRVWLTRITDLEGAVDVDEQLRAAAPSDPPYWMHLWPGAVALARMVADSPMVCPGRRVLEFGCGLALPAVTAAVCGASVVASDRVFDPLRYARRSATRSHASLLAVQMDWSALALGPAFDLILGSDIGYDFGRAAVLATAAKRLLQPHGSVWLADSVNIHRDDVLAALQQEGFTVRWREVQEEEEGRPVWVRLIEAQRPQ